MPRLWLASGSEMAHRCSADGSTIALYMHANGMVHIQACRHSYVALVVVNVHVQINHGEPSLSLVGWMAWPQKTSSSSLLHGTDS